MVEKNNLVWVWDRWQQEVLDYEGNVTIRSGRQVGKSVVIAEKAVRFALAHEGSVILVIAASQRQASLLFEKVRGTFELRGSVFREPPTLSKILLENGSKVLCLPAGKTGHFIRGFTVDLLIADEAAYIPEVVWNSVIPMIAVSRKLRGFGWLFLLSTPFGKGGFFYNSFTDPDFRQWHVSSEDCSRIPRSLLVKERKRMSKAEYAQEWLGEFCEEWNQFFPSELLKRQMTFIEWRLEDRWVGSCFYLGVDVARYGSDESAFVVVELHADGRRLRAVRCFVSEKKSTVDLIRKVLELDEVYKFRRVFVDDGGVGGAVTDVLQDRLGRKVVGLNNASKSVYAKVEEEDRRKGILKEDLYSNTLVLLEQGWLELISDLRLLRSLKSMTFEYSEKVAGRVKIFGDYSHLCEALVRACWCVKDRGLDVYLF